MASICITEAAESAVHRLYAELGKDEEAVMPFLLVRWVPRSMENSRGSHGEAIWEELAPAQWAAEVAGWQEARGKAIEEQALHVGGLSVLLDTHAEAAAGSLLVDAVNGRLVVTPRAS